MSRMLLGCISLTENHDYEPWDCDVEMGLMLRLVMYVAFSRLGMIVRS